MFRKKINLSYIEWEEMYLCLPRIQQYWNPSPVNPHPPPNNFITLIHTFKLVDWKLAVLFINTQDYFRPIYFTLIVIQFYNLIQWCFLLIPSFGVFETGTSGSYAFFTLVHCMYSVYKRCLSDIHGVRLFGNWALQAGKLLNWMSQ